MNHAFKTKNGNYLIPDKKNTLRFIDADGNHIRFVDREEGNYLVRVLEPIDLDDIPKFYLDKKTMSKKLDLAGSPYYRFNFMGY